MPPPVVPPAASDGGSTGGPTTASQEHAFGSPVVNGPSIGSPLVSPAAPVGQPLVPHWVRHGARPHVFCEGVMAPQVTTPQCPYEPPNAQVVRLFPPVETAVIACQPPANTSGRLALRVHFHGCGMPEEIYFVDVEPTEDQALCVGRVLCALRLPPFRAPTATVNYEYLLYVTSREPVTE